MVALIVGMNLLFSVDSILTVVGMTDIFLVMVISVVVSVALMLAFAVTPLSNLIWRDLMRIPDDVRALSAPGALEAAAALDVPVCIMHMQGEPRTMQSDPRYDDVVAEVGDYLERRVEACVAAGIARDRLVVDPGFGFGKTTAHNLALLRHLDRLVTRPGLPLLVGFSRKRSIGEILGGVPADERVDGSLAVAVLAVERGARIIRTHDVRPTRDALAVTRATLSASE